jgi:biopolymer transport protein TolR
MDSQGRIEFDRKILGLGALQKELRTQAGQNKGRPVLVRADHALAYGRVIEVVDVIRELGFTQVGFVTQGAPPVREDRKK